MSVLKLYQTKPTVTAETETTADRSQNLKPHLKLPTDS